jgi:1-pyrroline-5-carboxylate dehydrogenase
MQHPHIPRVTYTNLGVDFSTLHEMLDREIPATKARLGGEIPHFIGGKEDRGGPPYTIVSPIDRTLTLAICHAADEATVKRAIGAARTAFRGWAATDWPERVRILEEAARLLGERRFDLGIACLLEVGKSRLEAIGEAEEALDVISFYAEEMRRNDGYVRKLSSAVPGEHCATHMRPYGVFGIVSPFNFPLSTPINLASAAMMAGNTVVLKPSEGSALTASIIADCFLRSGLPPGVFNVIMGGDETGKALIAGDIDGAGFTGSTEVGHAIHAQLGKGPGVRPVIAEMGGKNPTIVSRTADLEAAAEGLARSAFGLQGEKCSSCEVAYIDEAIYDRFVPMLAAISAKFKVGNPENADAFVGPLIDEKAGERYASAVKEARAAGKIVFGGNRLTGELFDKGVYVEPLIVADLPPEHTQVRKELFLPYLAVQRYKTLAEAVERANGVDYGLTAGFYGRDESDLRYFLDNIEAGTVYANRRTGATTGAWPGVQSFGGWKASSLTGKNAFGPHYLPLFMREQNRTLKDV